MGYEVMSDGRADGLFSPRDSIQFGQEKCVVWSFVMTGGYVLETRRNFDREALSPVYVRSRHTRDVWTWGSAEAERLCDIIMPR